MDLAHIARTFPLVARPRPACPPLEIRIRQLHELAMSAEAEHQGEDDLATAASVLNLAALVASDCGLPELARTLCWQHANVFLTARPLSARRARYALEPLVNLARLLIREGQPLPAYQLLDQLYRGTSTRSIATIDGRRLSLRRLTATEQDHRSVCQWLWTVLLADGTRALAGAGRWADARRHVQQHQGIGRRLLDGRQVAVLAEAVEGGAAEALTLLDATEPEEPWEKAVAGCLDLLCRLRLSHRVRSAAALATYHYLEQSEEPGLLVFRTRLGLTCRSLAMFNDIAVADEVTRLVIRETLNGQDGYAAREILRHLSIRAQLKPSETAILIRTVETAGLEAGTIPEKLRSTLLDAVQISTATVRRACGASSLLGNSSGSSTASEMTGEASDRSTTP